MSRAVVALATLGLMLGDQLHGQERKQTVTTGQRNTAVVHVLQNFGDLTFAVLDRAMSECRYEIVHVRWVRDGSQEGRWFGLEEGIHQDIDANGDPRYRLELLRLTAQNLTNDQLDQRRKEYEGRAEFIHLFQSFRVHDVQQAEANYRIYPIDVDEPTRLGRPILRVVVYPLRWDRSIWILDVDTETGYPLYSAEYNNRGQRLSVLIVTEFNPGKGVVTEDTRWKPTMTVVRYDSVEAARQALGDRCRHMIDADANDLPPGYKRSVTQTVEDHVTGNMNYVNFFTDGIDNVFLVQTSGAENPLKPLREDGAHTVFEYRDLNVAQYVFYQNDVRFMIVGRSALRGLQSAVESMYRKAIK